MDGERLDVFWVAGLWSLMMMGLVWWKDGMVPVYMTCLDGKLGKWWRGKVGELVGG